MNTSIETSPRKDPVFLVSTGRTGTKFFAALFRRHAVGVSAHHICPGTRRQNILNGMAALGLLPQQVADAWLAKNTVARIRSESLRWIECNLYYFNSIAALRRSFPESRFVHVSRHPRGFCESHIRWERQRLQSRIANQLIPFWAPVAYHEQLLGIFGSYHQRVRYYAQVWASRNRIMLDQLEGDDSAIFLRFEDVFGSTKGNLCLEGLFHSLDIELRQPITQGVLAQRQNQTMHQADAAPWDDVCDRLIARHCSALMQRFGYSLDPTTTRELDSQ